MLWDILAFSFFYNNELKFSKVEKGGEHCACAFLILFTHFTIEFKKGLHYTDDIKIKAKADKTTLDEHK
jgi:hypothetical protein